MTQEELEEKLHVGARVKVGKEYSLKYGFEANEEIELIEGFFENDNGLYVTTETCPSYWDEKHKDFDSIYHMFGNDLEYFMDCEVIE